MSDRAGNIFAVVWLGFLMLTIGGMLASGEQNAHKAHDMSMSKLEAFAKTHNLTLYSKWCTSSAIHTKGYCTASFDPTKPMKQLDCSGTTCIVVREID